METKTPISLAVAVQMADTTSREAASNGRLGIEPGQTYWYWSHFIEWISSLGFHIELSGDEFEPVTAAPLMDC